MILVDELELGFMDGVGTMDATFRYQLQEKYLVKRRNLYLAFVDLKKALDHVLRKIIWWAVSVFQIPEWNLTLAKVV